MPRISVIINCLNGERYLREAMDSVFAQTCQDWEIIFWDNASTDRSGDIARSYGERVRYFRSETTTSLGRARNLAISHAKGDYVALLDCDDIWLPQKLGRQLEVLEDNRKAALCFSNSMFFNSEGDVYDHFSQARPARGDKVFDRLLESNFIGSETMFFRRTALETLDYVFDEDFTMVMDYDLTLRLAYKYPIDYVEDILSKWRMHEGSESNKKRFLIPRENMAVLERLILRHPELPEKHQYAISRFRHNVNYQLAMEKWDRGMVKESRNMLRQCKLIPKAPVAYAATFLLPFSRFDRIKENLKTKILGGRLWKL